MIGSAEIVVRAISQRTIKAAAHRPKTAVRPDQQAMMDSARDRGDRRNGIGDQLLRYIGKHFLAVFDNIARAPERAIRLEKKTRRLAGGDGHDITGDDLRAIGRNLQTVPAIAKLPEAIITHSPEAAIGFDEQAMLGTCGNIGHRDRGPDHNGLQ